MKRAFFTVLAFILGRLAGVLFWLAWAVTSLTFKFGEMERLRNWAQILGVDPEGKTKTELRALCLSVITNPPKGRPAGVPPEGGGE